MEKIESKKTDNSKRKYWQSLEERITPPKADWLTPDFAKSQHEMEEESRGLKLGRKDFLKFMGAGAVMVGAACRRPTEQIVPAVIQSPEMVPGNPLYYASTAPDGTGIIVRTKEGRPVKISGNPDHPLSRGGVTAWNIASVMDLYDPDRLRRPMKLSSGRKSRATEEEIVTEAQKKLSEGKYVLITKPIDSPSSEALIDAFLDKYPGGRHLELRPDPTLRQITEGQKASYGTEIVPFYRVDRAELIVSIDGDILGTMIAPSVFTAAFGKKRDLRNGAKAMNRLISFESMYSVTGSNADERYAIRPGDQATVALALAAHLVYSHGAAAPGGARELLGNYLPEKVSKTLGISAADLEKVASELSEYRGKSLVIGASPLAANGNNTSLQVAVNLLNTILDNDGKTVDHAHPINLSEGSSDSEIQEVFNDIKNGRIKTVVLGESNPLYHLPAFVQVKEALEKASYILSLNDRIDESSLLASAILPASHYLESWGDAQVVPGIYSVRQPVIRPLYGTRSLEDRLIQLSGGNLAGVTEFHEFVKKRWETIRGGNGASFRTFWQSALQSGYFAPGRTALEATTGARNFNGGSLKALPTAPDSSALAAGEFSLGLYYNNQVLDGAGANNAYRQELPDPVTKCTWMNYAVLSPATARELKLKQGAVVEVKTQYGKLELPVHLQPGIHPQALLIALGYGREAGGQTADCVGANALALAGTGSDSFTFSGIKATLSPTGDRIEIPNTQTIYRHGFNTEDRAFFAPGKLPGAPLNGSRQDIGSRERPNIRETTLEDFIKNPGKDMKPEAVEFPENAEVMEKWEYVDARWHMTIDLNQCTGCGACVTSCNLENNVPMVGPAEIIVGREMHWLRIDRYFSGGEENAEVAHQPMLCQHCENAPCENVCPVAATTHNHEGLNVMTYNRCVGTRYCANNCPFKVRRFNWFENWTYMEGLERKLKDPQQLGLNPDVAVRTRGVMEKCTFCIHRIAAARQESRARGEAHIPDGSIITACQEVCPTKAITFGNINDPDSRVARLSKGDKRAYKVLDFLSVAPSITYLAKVRNKG